jgi:hypothetical protein
MVEMDRSWAFVHPADLQGQDQGRISEYEPIIVSIRYANLKSYGGQYLECLKFNCNFKRNYSLRSKILVILALDLYIYIQMDDNESRHIYKLNILIIIQMDDDESRHIYKLNTLIIV